MAESTIACAQIDCALGRPESNRNKILDGIRTAARAGASLVIFPECAVTGYCFESLAEAAPHAEPIEGPTSKAIADACRETGAYAVVGFIEKSGDNFFNAAMLVGPDGVAGSYRKVHLPYLGVDRFLTPGDTPFAASRLPIGNIGINICYDASFPEAARMLKLLGAQLLVLPTNWPTGAWRTPEYVVNTRAQENHINFAAANRVGEERGWRFIGRSMIVDFNGDTVSEASRDNEEMLYGRLDLEAANANRIVNVPGQYEIDRLADRRPEFYGRIGLPSYQEKA